MGLTTKDTVYTVEEAVLVNYAMGTAWVALPPHLRRPTNGTCDCPVCAAHPTWPPLWDTLAIDLSTGQSWTVHMPDFRGRLMKQRKDRA
jgi:hypothetical protein